MGFKIESVQLNGITVLAPDVFEDERGFFMEVYRTDQFRDAGLPAEFVQDNHSRSTKNVLRGMHFQWNPPQGKLVRVIAGAAYLAWVDIRKNSPTLGKWCGLEVSAHTKKMVYVPPGFANGFCVLSDIAEIQYKCTAIYNRSCEGNILWNDPDVGIVWPVREPILSGRDLAASTLKQWLATAEAENFVFKT